MSGTKKNNLEYAKWLGMYYLGFRAHTRGQMLDKLKRKEIDDKFCQEALAYFEENGYINDFEYALNYIRSASANRKDGAMKVRQKLRERKINSEVIDNAFAEAGVDFSGSLERAIMAKARNLNLQDRKDREKLIAHLARKGFKIGEILSKIGVILDE